MVNLLAIIAFVFFAFLVIYRGKLKELKSVISQLKLFLLMGIAFASTAIFGYIAYPFLGL